MALHILDRPDAYAQLGTALGTGLEALAHQKLQDLSRRQTAFGLGALEGINPQMAQQLSYLDPQSLGVVLKDLLARPGQEAYAAALGLGTPNQAQQAGVEQSIPQYGTTEETPQQIQDQIGGVQQQGIQKLQPTKIAPKARLTEKQATELAKMRLEQQKLAKKEQSEIDKETLPFYNESIKSGKVASHNDKILDRVEQLVTKGNLGSPLLNSAIDTISHGIFGIGINLNSLKTADAQELEKLSIEFVKNAKEIFGNRLTDLDLKTYVKSLVNLSQSREGMQRVIQNMRIANGADKLRSQATAQIVRENGGRRPRDLEQLVEERISPQLDQLADQFKIGALNQPTILGSEVLGKTAQALNLIY